MPLAILDQSAAAADPRFNAIDHGFSGETVVVRPQDAERFRDLERKFHIEWKPDTETETTFVDEMAAHKFQMQNIQDLINKLLAEKGDAAILTDDYRLLRRYLNEHRRDFYRAFNSINSLRKSKEQTKRLNAELGIDAELRRLNADTNRLSAIVKASETDFFRANPGKLNDYFRILDPVDIAATS